MRCTVVTAFPDLLRAFGGESIIGKAVERGILKLDIVNPRDFAEGDFRQIDDYSFGGGGMVLMAEPLARAVESVRKDHGGMVVYPGPQGAVLNQEMVESLAGEEHIIIVCGHYEGVDERFVERCVDLEVSIGDYVLTGGEIPAMVLIDAVARKIPGVVGNGSAVEEDSFFRGMLDHPHYTRPAEWRDYPAPPVVLQGDHAAILAWRRRMASERTLARRPDILSRAGIGPYLAGGLYVILVSIENRDDAPPVEAVSELCGFYGCERLVVSAASAEVRCRIKDMFPHGGGPRVFAGLGRALGWIEKKEKARPLAVAAGFGGGTHWLELKRRMLAYNGPTAFVFSDENNRRNQISETADLALQPVRGGKGESDLSLAPTVAVTLDRFIGWR